MGLTARKLVALNDSDGNIRHGWEVFDGERIVARVKSGYMGTQALRNVLESLGVDRAQELGYPVEGHEVGPERHISADEWNALDDPPAGSV